MKVFKNRSIGFYLEAIATVLSIVVLILGVTQKGLVKDTSFGISIILPIALGAAAFVAYIFLDYDFMPLIVSLLLTVAFGFLVSQSAEVVNDKMLNIEFSGGNFDQVLTYLIGLGLAVILTIVACYLPGLNNKGENNGQNE